MATTSQYPHLETDENSNVRISGTRYKAKHLAGEHFQYGWSAEEILRQHPDLRPEQVYSALTWFYDNYAAVVADLSASLERSEQQRSLQQLSRDELLRRRLSAVT
jgi:uncharacterized protein (DUF433 family)